MNQPFEPDDRLAQRVREAHALLDEQPSAKVRSAILLAAAQRHRGAPSAHAQRASARSIWPRLFAWRPPLAAGAAVFAGVLAITIGLRVQREQGAVAPAPAPAASEEGGAAPRAKAPSLMPARPTIETGRSAPAPEGDSPVLRNVPVPLGAAQPKAALSAPPASAAGGASGAVQSQMQPAPASALAPSAPAAAAARSASSGNVAEPGVRARRAQEAIPNLQPGALTDRQALIEPARQRAPAADANTAYTASPEQWLKHIAELRAAQRDAEAEQELARFTAAYPSLAVPPGAQRR